MKLHELAIRPPISSSMVSTRGHTAWLVPCERSHLPFSEVAIKEPVVLPWPILEMGRNESVERLPGCGVMRTPCY
jgi:hypothetical protein